MNKKILEAKKAAVTALTKKIKESTTTVIVEYRGLSVARLSDLRRQLKAVDASLTVYKNTLFAKAAAGAGVKGLEPALTGANAFVFAKSVVEAPKVLAKFARKNPELVLKAGHIENRIVDEKDLKEISRLPGREGLIAMFLSCLQAPIRKFACLIKAVAEKQQAS